MQKSSITSLLAAFARAYHSEVYIKMLFRMSIIHIVDLDGTFIPEDSIIESDTGKIKYTENTIECMTRSDIVGRNRKKPVLFDA